MHAPLARLEAVHGPLPAHVRRAFEAVPAELFLPPPLEPLAGADAPLPFFDGPTDVAVTPSPRVLALLLQLLELEAAPSVLLVGAESGYLGALAAAAGACRVRVVEPGREVAEAAAGFVARAGAGVEVRAGPPAREAGPRPWDRVLLLDPSRSLGSALQACVAEGGFAARIEHTSEGFGIAKAVRAGGALAELRAPTLALGGGVPGEAGPLLGAAARRTLTGLMALEEMATRVWRGGPGTAAEASIRAGVDEVWARPDADVAAPDPQGGARRRRAVQAFHLGYLHQAAGDLANAADLYRRSDAVLGSAEARTFLGWACALEGRLEEAIGWCERAIAADPTLGNPYNDIGAYLLDLGKPAEAVPWLHRALEAPRYEARSFPHLNLGRAHLALAQPAAARAAAERALALEPGSRAARDLLHRIEAATEPPG